jgi:hypothetical protein
VPLGLGAALIVLDQGLQMRAALGAVDWSVPISRFQAAALFTGRLAAFVVAGLLTLFAASTARSRSGVRAHGVVSIGLALVLTGCLVLLWIDGPAVKTSVPGDQIEAFTAQWIRGLVVALTGAPLFAIFGVRLLLAR